MPPYAHSRRRFLQLSLTAACGVHLGSSARTSADDVSWLDDVTVPPADLPTPHKPLSDLLIDARGMPVTDLAGWQKQREQLLAQWSEFLGRIDQPAEHVEFRVVESEQIGNLRRTLISYQTESAENSPAYVLAPADLKPNELRPGIVALHPTTAETIKPIAGLSGPEDKHSAVHLAQAGFVVICPENFLWQNTTDYNAAVAEFKARNPKSLGMAKMLADAVCAVDVLQSLDHVDPERLGAFGHSLGAKEALYLAAFDPRIKAAVASEGGIPFDSTNWNAPWYLGTAIDDPKFPLDHHQILALIAPKPFLVLGGESGRGAADGVRSWPYLAAAQRVYERYETPPRMGLLNHRQGHSIPLAARTRAIEWLQRYTAFR